MKIICGLNLLKLILICKIIMKFIFQCVLSWSMRIVIDLGCGFVRSQEYFFLYEKRHHEPHKSQENQENHRFHTLMNPIQSGRERKQRINNANGGNTLNGGVPVPSDQCFWDCFQWIVEQILSDATEIMLQEKVPVQLTHIEEEYIFILVG